jgi:GntR family transcriptional regulator, transcriptional repressor for pyruvate dehydrogenase complex
VNHPAELPILRRHRSLAQVVVEGLQAPIRDGRVAPGTKLPSEGEVMAAFGVSRTVVREALSRLQASGLVATRHGVGSFVVGRGDEVAFRIGPQQLETLRDVVAMLELRIGVETEAAGLAAQRRTPGNLADMRAALDGFGAAIEAGDDAVGHDYRFHSEIARATQNAHFIRLLETLGVQSIPRARLDAGTVARDAARLGYLRRVNAEHESIHDAIARQDAQAARAAMRTHLVNSRERRRRAAQPMERPALDSDRPRRPGRPPLV